MYNEKFLQHYGILGMHWGRRSRSSSPVKKPKPVVINKDSKFFNKKGQELSGDFANKLLLNKKPVREMSNAELKSLNERLQLERQLTELRSNEKQQQTGLNFVKKVTATGTTIASLYALSKTPLAQDAAKIIKSKL